MSSETSTNALQPWQFFVLAALGCATAVTFVVRSQGVMSVILVTVIMATSALVGIGVLRAIRPLVSPHDERGFLIGQRTRAGLEQEKALSLRTIKELEFDRAMGKISEDDFNEMSVRLRARAARIMKQLDAGEGHRARIERELAKRLGDGSEAAAAQAGASVCRTCSTRNDPDAKFCKSCGERLG